MRCTHFYSFLCAFSVQFNSVQFSAREKNENIVKQLHQIHSQAHLKVFDFQWTAKIVRFPAKFHFVCSMSKRCTAYRWRKHFSARYFVVFRVKTHLTHFVFCLRLLSLAIQIFTKMNERKKQMKRTAFRNGGKIWVICHISVDSVVRHR